MYNKGDYVVYENSGVCEIIDIVSKEYPSGKKRKSYVLKPMIGNGLIYTPVDNDKVCIRDVITKKKALAVIDKMPTNEIKSYAGLKSQDAKYRECMQTHDISELVKLQRSIYLKAKEAKKNNKKVSELDDRYLKHLQDIINGEFSMALNIPTEEVEQFISDRIKSKKKSK